MTAEENNDAVAHRTPTPRQALVLAAKGFCMGVAEVIPGVSGATIALILGIYRRFVDAIRAYTPNSVIDFLRAIPRASSDRANFLRAAKALHLEFLIPLFVGMGAAILIASKTIPPLMKAYPAHADAVFFGLIVSSVTLPWSMIPNKSPVLLVPVVAAAALAFFLVGLPATTAGAGSLAYVFFCAVIAICAFILPGVSGSYMLKVFGQYEHVLGAIHRRDIVVIAVFGLGVIVGITSFVRLLSLLLRRYPSLTLAVLTGLMAGSLRSVWPFKAEPGVVASAFVPSTLSANEAGIVGAAVAGIVVVMILKIVDKKTNPESHSVV